MPGRRFLDEIPVTEMVLPLVVIDTSAACARDSDYCIQLSDVRQWEERHGRIPCCACCAKTADYLAIAKPRIERIAAAD